MSASALWPQPPPASRRQQLTRFVRNTLCAFLSRAANTPRAAPDQLLSLLLNPALKLGTSTRTPNADPAGDWPCALFRRSYALLDAKVLQLTGSPTAVQPPAGRGADSWLMPGPNGLCRCCCQRPGI